MDVVRPRAQVPPDSATPTVPAAAWPWVRFVGRVVAWVVVVGLSASLLLVATFSTIEAIVAVAIPTVVVRLAHRDY